MDEQVIWDIYWKFQNGPAGARMSIFDLFAELDKNMRLFLLIPILFLGLVNLTMSF